MMSENFAYPATLLYSPDHEWVAVRGIEALIGITAFAADQLGDIVYLDVPELGKSLEKGAVFGTIEAVKTVSDLFMPLSGIVLEVNPKVIAAPEMVNGDPYEWGWLVKIHITKPEEAGALLTAEAYQKLI
jgi:glycine cleavage system H protein